MWWLVYNTNDFTIYNRFYLEKDAKKKARKMVRERFNLSESDVGVEYIGDSITEKQWKMWKQLQR